MIIEDGQQRQAGCIRTATADDLPRMIALDEAATNLAKPQYWHEMLDNARQRGRAILVAEIDGRIVGFITGEVRAWEFGSPPCGWIFGLAVDPDYRQHGIATELFDAMCAFFRKGGVTRARTMLRRDDHLVMAFFRSQGMMAGPFVQLEKDLDE